MHDTIYERLKRKKRERQKKRGRQVIDFALFYRFTGEVTASLYVHVQRSIQLCEGQIESCVEDRRRDVWRIYEYNLFFQLLSLRQFFCFVET